MRFSDEGREWRLPHLLSVDNLVLLCGESEKGLKVNGDKREMMLGGKERSVCVR